MNQKSIDTLKIGIIQQISLLEDALVLHQIEQLLRQLTAKQNAETIQRLAKPTRPRLDLATLKKQQGFTVFNEKRFHELIDLLNIQEPVEFLTKQL
jgi:hypothetical protein